MGFALVILILTAVSIVVFFKYFFPLMDRTRTDKLVVDKPMDHNSNIGSKCSPAVKPKRCFRISGIPKKWDERMVVAEIQKEAPAFKGPNEPWLFPSCTGSHKIALVYIDESTSGYFSNINIGHEMLLKVGNPGGVPYWQVDRHFHEMTPLNDPEDKISADDPKDEILADGPKDEISAEFVTYLHLFMEGGFRF
jgi:hypothetical protein